ncbi:MAG: LysM peptidoglycan-binding domain-containing protein [Chloroflexi bacterium]|nr:LysM peptidoglycan-binding domain-containing protein [Chloroflexota bacterium]
MRLGRVLPFVACCLVIGGGLAAACGGGSSSGKAPDSSKIPTATLPATLPEPRIVSSGAVQPGGGSSYTVKEGDTLAGIAGRFGVSLEDLLAANPSLDASRLSIGQAVKLPPSEAPPAAATPTAASTEPPATAAAATATAVETPTEAPPTSTPPPAATNTPASLGQTYTVVEGDIPVTIAEKFGITVEALMAANPGVDPTALYIGQVLIIPPKPAG